MKCYLTKKMLLKKSGCEKMRCMLSRMMLMRAIYDNMHLNLESTALNINNSLLSLKVTILMTSKDQELIKTICNRILEIGSNGS